jgi:glycosyltransferase involved in cell wall biosynthesis
MILRDLFPQWTIDQGMIRQGSLVERYFRHFEKINYLAADTIGLMSNKNLEWFRQNVFVDAKTEVLYNWASPKPVIPTGQYRKQLGIEDKTIFFYGGNMGHAQDMLNIVRLAKNVQDEPEIVFVLVGAGDEVELVQESIIKFHLDNILVLPPVSQEEYKKMMSEFDIGLFTLHKDHKTHNFPGKLLGYMVQSIPILGSINPGNDLQEVIEQSSAGFVTINGDDEKFAENARRLLDRPLRKRMGKASNELLKSKFSTQSAARRTLASLKMA